jgi:hypothetical protein
MRRLLTAGVLYLITIAIVLAIKPKFMFSDDGTWKEFGIGRNPHTHTWMPFWLFAILMSLVSYIITTVLFGIFSIDSQHEEPQLRKKSKIIQEVLEVEPDDMEIEIVKPKRKSKTLPDLQEGYYVLNREATEAAGGVPKYVYLGKNLPED